MDTWLIFHDQGAFRWSDEVEYALRIIGFDVRAVRMISRKIRRSHLNVVFKRSEDVLASALINSIKHVPEKNL